MFPVSLTRDHNLIPNTMEPQMKKAVQTGSTIKNFSLLFAYQRGSECSLSEHFSRHTLDPTDVNDLMDRVRFPNKIRQAAWLDKLYKVAERVPLNSARELGAKSLRWLLKNSYHLWTADYSLFLARKLPPQNPVKAITAPLGSNHCPLWALANIPDVCEVAKQGSDSDFCCQLRRNSPTGF